MKVLVASCIRQDPDILEEFLYGLNQLATPVDYYFILHNLSSESKDLIYRWSHDQPAEVKFKIINDNIEYIRNDSTTHIWKRETVDKVIEMKNLILEKARERDVDYLFFTDSDQVYHPNTLIHLINQKKDIIGEICWTRYNLDQIDLPNAWMKHPYEFYHDSLIKMRTEPLLEVGGFGGCYLISRKALSAPISFNRIKGYPEWGEDRYFAIRAKTMGFPLFIDTVYPYFHIYRKSDLPRLEQWIKRGYKNEGVFTLQRGSVLIAICLGEKEIHADTVAWVAKTLLRNKGWGLEISRGHPIDSNRNTVVRKFMTLPEAQRYEWLLFLDSDVVPPPGAAERLLFHGKKIVGGVCWIMSNRGIPTLNVSKDIGAGYVKADLKEVNGMGTGFLLIHRDVLKEVGKSPFRYRYDEWGIANVSGEDYDFCDKATKKGYKIYADFTIQCEHYKTVGLKSINNKLSHIIDEVKQSERGSKRSPSNRDSGSISDRG